MAERLIDIRILTLGITLVLAGCVSAPSYPPSQPPGQQRPPVYTPPGTTAPTPYPQQPDAPLPGPATTPSPPRPDPSVTLALREESLQAAARGDNAQAIALIERAIRIEPDRPELWIDLASLHLEEGDAVGAEQFARKALLYTRTRHDLEQQAYLIISRAQGLR